jgi:hypothetical protein
MTYAVIRRIRPKSLRVRKRILGLPIGPKQDYERPWVLLRDGRPIGYYETEEDARDMRSALCLGLPQGLAEAVIEVGKKGG